MAKIEAKRALTPAHNAEKSAARQLFTEWSSIEDLHRSASLSAAFSNRVPKSRAARALTALKRLAKERLGQSGASFESIAELASVKSDETEKLLAAIPPGPEKAREVLLGLVDYESFDRDTESSVYEVLVYLRDGVRLDILGKVRRLWKTQAQNARAGGVFWASRNGDWEIDAVARYRFFNAFALGEFEEIFQGIERDLATLLTQEAHGHEARNVAYVLWVISRCPALSAALWRQVDLAFEALQSGQGSDGAWTTDAGEQQGRHGASAKPIGDTLTAAYFASAALRMRRPAAGAVDRACRWLARVQGESGGWGAAETGVSRSLNLATVVAFDALKRLGRSDHHNVRRAAQVWILEQQAPFGLWHVRDVPEPMGSVLVLEAMAAQPVGGTDEAPLLQSSIGLMRLALRLCRADDPASHQLAVLAAIHAAEAGIYALLDGVHKKFIETDGQTIGLANGISRFSELMQQQKKLGQADALPFLNSVKHLKRVRDDVAHRGVFVEATQAKHLISETHRFLINCYVLHSGSDPY